MMLTGIKRIASFDNDDPSSSVVIHQPYSLDLSWDLTSALTELILYQDWYLLVECKSQCPLDLSDEYLLWIPLLKTRSREKRVWVIMDEFLQVVTGQRSKLGRILLVALTCLLHHELPTIGCWHFLQHSINMIVSIILSGHESRFHTGSTYLGSSQKLSIEW